eukprot:CAMPEP_0177260520 /NCGR_PEP_ID=MMETSP0367-20130122/59305_1 /TAXON_ID=447022 ORGANISM="Scrippsiella hangoei-like, Strain SHHI-4" /NCGR_SAMPLE_ID=MMETSP0367 /ASSEMBLY_ACC=CAM_ASM_000362 /LENGTH=551 /DNA_ID=CAMNT_0018715049 /DNA_START=92 /DNA_END=1747 /DNA_ORIENTATION=+
MPAATVHRRPLGGPLEIMVALPDKVEVPSSFADNFMGTDQDVKELDVPRPETSWCLLELPQKEIDALSAGSTFYFQSHEGGAGLDDGGAALCTDTETFSIEFLENSNSLFLAQVFEGPPASEGTPAPEVVEGGVGEKAENTKDTKPEAADGSCGGAQAEGSGGSEKVSVAGQAEAAGEKTLSMRCEVFGQVRGQMITKPMPFNKKRVYDLLSPQALGIDLKDLPVVTTDVLDYEVAASAAELRALLNEGPYVELEGAWRMLPPSLMRHIMDTAVNVVAAKGWDHQDLDEEALLKEVQQHLGVATVPTLAVLKKVLKSVEPDPQVAAPAAAETEKDSTAAGASETAKDSSTDPKSDTAVDSAEKGTAGDAAVASRPAVEGHLNLDKAKMLRFQALQLLQMPPQQVRERFGMPTPVPQPKRPRHGPGGASGSGGTTLLMEEFGTAFQEITGAAEKPTPEDLWKVLGDQAYLDEFEGSLHSLDPSTLPLDPNARLTRLFALQSHWNQGRLESFVAPVLGKGVKVATWVLKQTRAVFVELVVGKEERFLIKKFAM